ncbi:MAG: hypothetical protein L6Q35_13780 [Phycisphaerales bacterium]|nr:hypothetical protein [Phycisphaerales bacterium]
MNASSVAVASTTPGRSIRTAWTITAVALGLLVVDRLASPGDVLGPAPASAQVRSVSGGGGDSGAATMQDEPSDGRVNPAEQRKQMISELRTVNQRLDRIEAMLARGVSVKVVDMPELRLPKALEDRLMERSGN